MMDTLIRPNVGPQVPRKIMTPEHGRRRSGALFFMLIILVLLLALAAGYFYFTGKDSGALVEPLAIDGEGQEEVDVDALVREVGKLIVLPQNEKPTVATVSDLEKLKGQPFFANAKEGYRVLIYSESKKAILYNPEAKQIVEVGSLNLK